MLERLLAMLVRRNYQPPPLPTPPPAPRVTTTPLAERRLIDERLRGVESRIAVLLAEAGLDAHRGKGSQPSG